MGVFNKLASLGDITYSSAREKIKAKSIERKIVNIDKEIAVEKNNEIKEYLFGRKRRLVEELASLARDEGTRRAEKRRKLKSEVKNSIEKRKNEGKELSLPSKLRKELKGLPVVTLFDDLIEGASGIEKMEKYLMENQDNPYAYLILAEAIKYHKKTFFTIHGIKAPVDIIGTVIDVTSEYVGGFFDKIVDKDKWTYERALKQGLALAMAKKEGNKENLIIVGRSAFLLGWETKNITERQSYLKLAREFYERSLEEKDLRNLRGEIYYYLGEMYGSVGDKGLRSEYLIKSINEGFYPALMEYGKLVSKKGKRVYKIPQEVSIIKEFKFSYKKNPFDAALSGTANAITKQSQKILNTTERILDGAINKFMK